MTWCRLLRRVVSDSKRVKFQIMPKQGEISNKTWIFISVIWCLMDELLARAIFLLSFRLTFKLKLISRNFCRTLISDNSQDFFQTINSLVKILRMGFKNSTNYDFILLPIRKPDLEHKGGPNPSYISSFSVHTTALAAIWFVKSR